MKKPWVATIRRESGLIELVCCHGVGHPAVGSVHWLALHGKKGYGIHGCDGCCRSQEWKLADALEGVKMANKLLKWALRGRKGKCPANPPENKKRSVR